MRGAAPMLSRRAHDGDRSLPEQMLTFTGTRWDALPVKKHRLPVKLMATVWLATYVVCIGLVCSFILFEVLDIDGSDFPTPPSTLATPIKLAEPAHEIKRSLFSAGAQMWAIVTVVIVLLEGARLRGPETRRRVPPPSGLRGRRRLRLSLPRASLADVAVSA
jgi:hypothetical protein